MAMRLQNREVEKNVMLGDNCKERGELVPLSVKAGAWSGSRIKSGMTYGEYRDGIFVVLRQMSNPHPAI